MIQVLYWERDPLATASRRQLINRFPTEVTRLYWAHHQSTHRPQSDEQAAVPTRHSQSANDSSERRRKARHDAKYVVRNIFIYIYNVRESGESGLMGRTGPPNTDTPHRTWMWSEVCGRACGVWKVSPSCVIYVAHKLVRDVYDLAHTTYINVPYTNPYNINWV